MHTGFKKSLLIVSLSIIGMLLTYPAYAAEKKEEEVKAASAVQSERILSTHTSWDDVPYVAYPDGPPELTVIKMKIPPNTTLPWHTHPMPNVAYVLSGKLTVQKKDIDETMVISAGRALPEMVGALHRGITGDEPVELVIFYAGAKDMPLVQYPH